MKIAKSDRFLPESALKIAAATRNWKTVYTLYEIAFILPLWPPGLNPSVPESGRYPKRRA